MRYKPPAAAPHPLLVPLLEKYRLTHAQFIARGRPPKGSPSHLRAARAGIVTELHAGGMTWAQLIEVTGLSNGSVQRLTAAKGCEAVRARRRALGVQLGSSGRGKPRPGQLERQWAAGVFDFHRGRVRSEEERRKLRAAFTPERRAAIAARFKALWEDPVWRGELLAFHRSPEERVRRSAAVVRWMEAHPGRVGRGRAEWVETPKGAAPRAFARSSYEVAAVGRLEGDPEVTRYTHEPRFELEGGRWILPDFLVQRVDGAVLLIEVKASWVLDLPAEDRSLQRLQRAATLAEASGWGFAIWTEKELREWLPKKTARSSGPLSPPGDCESVPSLLGVT